MYRYHNTFQTVSFSDINISQGSVAMHVKCGGIFYYLFVRNLLSLKEFWKSVSIWQS